MARLFEVFSRTQPEAIRSWYMILFAVGFLSLLGLALLADHRAGDYRQNTIDFSALSKSELVIEQGMTRNQAAALKIGYIEQHEPPKIGVFGNHQIQYFNSSAFGKSYGPNDFFNFWYANLSLTENLDLLRYLESINKLPTQTILIQVTTPNNDNGAYILGYNGELLRDLVKFGTTQSETLSSRWTHWFQATQQKMLQVFNYSSLISGLIGGGGDSRIIDTQACVKVTDPAKNGVSGFYQHLPKILRQMIGLISKQEIYCDPKLWSKAFSNDGSHDGRYIQATPILNQNVLDPRRARLQSNDFPELVTTLKAIQALGQRNDRTVVLIIPPVYETNRISSVDRVFDRALSQVANLIVQDDRRSLPGKDAFVNYDHPNHRYFSKLAKVLKNRGFADLD
jgi:hypothetical protein